MSKTNHVSEMVDIVESLARNVIGYEDGADWDGLRDEVEDACQALLSLCASGDDEDEDDDDEEDDGPEELRFAEDDAAGSDARNFEEDEDFN